MRPGFMTAVMAALLALPVGVHAADLTGAHGGIQFGALRGEATGGIDGEEAIAGAHLGYDVDFGAFVLGAEVDADWGEIDLGGAATIDRVARFKLRAGTELGQAFVYGTAGVAQAETTLGSGDGGFAGIGAGWQIGERVSLGGELLLHRFEDIGGSGVDADATTATARVTFRF